VVVPGGDEFPPFSGKKTETAQKKAKRMPLEKKILSVEGEKKRRRLGEKKALFF